MDPEKGAPNGDDEEVLDASVPLVLGAPNVNGREGIGPSAVGLLAPKVKGILAGFESVEEDDPKLNEVVDFVSGEEDDPKVNGVEAGLVSAGFDSVDEDPKPPNVEFVLVEEAPKLIGAELAGAAPNPPKDDVPLVAGGFSCAGAELGAEADDGVEVVAFASYSFWTLTRKSLYCCSRVERSTKGSLSTAAGTEFMRERFSPRRLV